MSLPPKRSLAIAGMLIVGLLLLALVLRGALARWAVDAYIGRLEGQLGCSIGYRRVAMPSLGSLEVEGLYAHHCAQGIVLHLSGARITIHLPSLLLGRLRPKAITVDSLHFRLGSAQGAPPAPSAGHPATPPPNPLAAVRIPRPGSISKALRLAARAAQSDVSIRWMRVEYLREADTLSLTAQPFTFRDKILAADLSLGSGGRASRVDVAGWFAPPTRTLTLHMRGEGQSAAKGHGPHPQAGAPTVGTVRVELTQRLNSPDSIALTASIAAQGLRLLHPKLSDRPVELDSLALRLGIGVGPGALSLDSTSRIALNAVAIPFALTMHRQDGLPRVTLSSRKVSIGAQQLVESIPPGLFQRAWGLRVGGQLSFGIGVDLDLNAPDSLMLDIYVRSKDFHLLSDGALDIGRLNHPFSLHPAWGADTLGPIHVGPHGQRFAPLGQISPHLIHAVIAAEDAGFFSHRGFDPEGFRYAMARNIREGRLARGGSTITMQMVKNVFLDHRKTIGRKAEEAVIVWLIETLGLVSKERILEIYLNIIEWGPGIRGIGPAAEFYFAKPPAKLSLGEAIFLASLIRRPAAFHHHFDAHGQLGPHMEGYFRRMGGILHARGQIATHELDALRPQVVIRGRAAGMIPRGDAP